MRNLQKHPLITGAMILTLTGMITRLIGFFYRIYLARIFGEEGMGIYQLISPVLSLSFALTAAGYQTAVSKLVAEYTAREKGHAFHPLWASLSVCVPLSLLCTWGIAAFSEPIAARLLLEPRTASMLRILSFSVPVAAIHACINGYFYGLKRTSVPASSQLLEQCVRVACVYLLASYAQLRGKVLTVNVAVLGLVIGEILSMLLAVICMLCHTRNTAAFRNASHPVAAPGHHPGSFREVYSRLLHMVIPLTANRIVLNLLQSVEAVSIPASLRLYGYSTADALSVYGVLTGMAMPLIFFPNALTGSVSVLLLPMISEAHALGDSQKVKKYTLQTIRFCVLLGFLCMSVFLLTGRFLGETVFESELAGHFILTLSFLCPFLYLDTTLSSILQGLGMAGRVFVMNALSLVVRLVFVLQVVPAYGIAGYLWGILTSQILLTLLYLLCLFTSRRHLTSVSAH